MLPTAKRRAVTRTPPTDVYEFHGWVNIVADDPDEPESSVLQARQNDLVDTVESRIQPFRNSPSTFVHVLGGQGKTGHLSTLQNRPFPARDGKRFLIAAPTKDTSTSPITVVLEWAGRKKSRERASRLDTIEALRY
jgi:hypothetical protein